MADKKDDKLTEDLASEVVKVAAEIVSLKTVTNKLVAFGQRDSDRQTATAEKEQTERIDFLKQEIAAGDGRTKAIRALKFEMVGIETSIQDQANTNAEILANSAAALGMTEEEFKIQQSLQADSDRTNANLEKLGQQLMESGIKPEDLMGIESYAEMSADAAEKQESVSIEALRNQPSEAAATEDAEEAQGAAKGQETLLSKIAGGIGGLRDMGKKKLKDAGKGIKNMLIGTAIAGFSLALVAFLNSPLWEKTKAVLVDDVLPALVNIFNFLKDVIVPPIVKLFGFIKDEIWPIIRDSFIKSWESIKKVFSGIGEAFDMFSEGDILGGITKLFGSLGTFFLETFDNMITSIFNLLGAVFGFEGTDSVGGSIMKFFTDIKDGVVNKFIAIKDFLAEQIDIVIESITSAFDGVFLFIKDLFDFSDMSLFEGFMKFIDIVYLPLNLAVNFLKNLFGFGEPDEPFKLSEFLFGPEGIISKAIQAIKDIFPSFEDLKAMIPSASEFLSSLNPFGGNGDEPEGKSKGGPIKAGVPYLVGEKGPELIVPGAASMVFPTEKTADIRTQQINQAGVERSGGGGSPVVVDAKSTNVVNSNSSSSATFTSTSLQHPNPLIKTLNYAF